MKKILVIAPHPDDEIIGVGGTIAKSIEQGNKVYVCVVTKGKVPLFSETQVEEVQREARLCHEILGIEKSFFLDLPAAMLESVQQYELNAKMISVIKEVQADEVFIPHSGDMHKDHRIVAESAMVALRPKYSFAPKRIYAYETLSETGWNIPNIQNEFISNAFVDISDFLSRKLEAMNVYQSQLAPFPDARSLEAIEALAKYRGAVMNVKAAEAFMLIREVR